MEPTPSQRLASLALGTEVMAWVTARRSETPQPSFQRIANELRAATDGQADVTDETIRLWCLRAKHGCCPNCTVPTWHNGDACPEQVAS